MARACIVASGLSKSKMIVDKASFSDRMTMELRIVEGYSSQSVINVKLCAYDRKQAGRPRQRGLGDWASIETRATLI